MKRYILAFILFNSVILSLSSQESLLADKYKVAMEDINEILGVYDTIEDILTMKMYSHEFSWGIGYFSPYNSVIVQERDNSIIIDNMGIEYRVEKIAVYSDMYKLNIIGSDDIVKIIEIKLLKSDVINLYCNGDLELGNQSSFNFLIKIAGPNINNLSKKDIEFIRNAMK